MNKMTGTIQTETVDQFSINGQPATGIAFDFNSNEIVIMRGTSELSRVPTRGFDIDVSTTCEVKIKLPR